MKPASLVAAVAGLALTMPASAQTNDNLGTPLGSRIARDRQIQRDLARTFDPARTEAINGQRRSGQLHYIASCMYGRSNEKAHALLRRTDYGFTNPAQIDTTAQKLGSDHGIGDCMQRVANSAGRNTMLRMGAGNIRAMLLQQAYFDRHPDKPDWIRAGYTTAAREYPLSQSNSGVRAAMDFADCVVATDPVNADYFYRAPEESPEEKAAIGSLTPSLGPCLGEGHSIELTPFTLRVMLGEALWHAATNSVPAPATEDAE